MNDKTQYDPNRSTHEQKNNPEKLGTNDSAEKIINKDTESPKGAPARKEIENPNANRAQEKRGQFDGGAGS